MRETGIKKLNHFLAHIRCDTLILNGDFIDGWALKLGRVEKGHTRCIRLILKMVEKREKPRSFTCGETMMISSVIFYLLHLIGFTFLNAMSFKDLTENISCSMGIALIVFHKKKVDRKGGFCGLR